MEDYKYIFIPKRKRRAFVKRGIERQTKYIMHYYANLYELFNED
ncbi:hypothetical protein [Parelusimicrobium proximum]